jgi:endonuclease I
MRKNLYIVILCFLCLSAYAEEMPDNYYVRANGKKDAVLKDSLKSCIRNHTAISYGSGANSTWGVFYYSDQDADGYCMDMYCDNWYKFSSPGTAVTGCNIEHSFAKSWWGGGENDAYKDCYHLNPSNSTANSSRSNYPLGVPTKDFKDQSTTGSLKVGKMHHETMNVDFWVFEPKDEYKGDFARAYFYMATCYGHWTTVNRTEPVLSQYSGWRLDNSDVGSKFAMQNDNYLEFQPWEQEVLIQWHRQDPVSEKEINRQDAVSNFQHNRNPYIDYPYLAEYIWGDHAGEEVDFSLLMPSSDPDFIPGVSDGWREGSVTPTPKPKYGVTWSVNGATLYVDSIVEKKKVSAFPETPVSCSAESAEFIGWAPSPIDGMLDEEPAVLYKEAKDIPMVTADITLYAVFARKTTIDGGVPATYIFDDDNQTGWTTNASHNSGSYWLLDAGKTLVSPEINLAGLDSIIVKIRTYGGKDYNTVTVSAGSTTIATITTTTGTTLTRYAWKNTSTLTGESALTFSTNYGSGKGIGLAYAIIKATGTRTTFDRYITSCQETTELIENSCKHAPIRKILIGGHVYILIGDELYNIMGQRVK